MYHNGNTALNSCVPSSSDLRWRQGTPKGQLLELKFTPFLTCSCSQPPLNHHLSWSMAGLAHDAFIVLFGFSVGQKRSERALFEEFRRISLHTNAGHVHKVETSPGAFPAGHLPPLRQPEDVFPLELALLPCHVFIPFEKPGPQNVESCFR